MKSTKKKLVFILLASIIILSACSSGQKPKHPKTVYGQMPVIAVSEEQKQENMFWYASYTAANFYLKMEKELVSFTKAYIGERVEVYVVDENGQLRQKGSPYYYPVILDEIPRGYVAVYSGENDLYTTFYYGGLNPYGISDTQMYALCGGTGITSLRTTYDDQKNGRTYEFARDLTKPFIILSKGDLQDYIITEDAVYDFMERKRIDETDEYISSLREKLKDMDDYQIHELPEEMEYVNDKVYYVENVLSDAQDQENRSAALEYISSLPDFSKEKNRISIGEMINSWYVIVNTDLSRTVMKDINPAVYPLLQDGKPQLFIRVIREYDQITCTGIPGGFMLIQDNWDQLKGDYLHVRDNIYQVFNSLIITENELIYDESFDPPIFPILFHGITDELKKHLGE